MATRKVFKLFINEKLIHVGCPRQLQSMKFLNTYKPQLFLFQSNDENIIWSDDDINSFNLTFETLPISPLFNTQIKEEQPLYNKWNYKRQGALRPSFNDQDSNYCSYN